LRTSLSIVKEEEMKTSLPETERNRLKQALKSRDLRPTRQRTCVYGVILDKRDHPTADDIHLRVREKLPSISLATIYNCLETLVECELVKQVHLDRAPTRFCPNRTPHAHFHCRDSGQVFDVSLDDERLSTIEQFLPHGFTADTIELSFLGRGPETNTIS
jgi:Fur family transcriptional regulator, peroxide stress response regulator